MRQPISIVAGVVAFLSCAQCVDGAETRIYRFVVDGSLPYFASCGECGPPLAGHRADVAGTFTVSLDPDAGTGVLQSLDDLLVNLFDVLYSPSGLVLAPGTLEGNSGIIPYYYPELEPPLEGDLASDGGTLLLASDGMRPIGGGAVQPVPPYTIRMTGDTATFNMIVPIADFYITVTNAQAVRVSMAGDHNNDGRVDAADYVVWRDGLGSTHTQGDYASWRTNFGQTAVAPSNTGAGAPEPQSFVLLLSAMLFLHSWHRYAR